MEEDHQKRLENQTRYRQSNKGKLKAVEYRLLNKEKHKAYKMSDKYKTYVNSEKYKQSQREYAKSPKMKAWKKEYNKNYHQTDKYKDYQKEYKESNVGKEVFKLYRQKDKYKQYHKQYQKEFRLSERGKEWTRKWNKSPLAKYLNLKRKLLRRERENNCIHSFSKEEWKLKCVATKNVCPYCDKPFDEGFHKLTLDHIFAVRRANEYFKKTGNKYEYTIDDVQPICLSCNCSKGDKLIEELKPKGLNTHKSDIILTTI